MLERGSIVLDGDLAKVAELRSALERRWEEKVDVSDVLIGLLRLDKTEQLEVMFHNWLWSLSDQMFYSEYLQEMPICDLEDEEEVAK